MTTEDIDALAAAVVDVIGKTVDPLKLKLAVLEARNQVLENRVLELEASAAARSKVDV